MKVAEFIFKVKNLLEANLELREVWVEGELSEIKVYEKSNSIYFNLKDETSDCILPCFISKDYYPKLINKILWQQGKKIKIFGYITVWNKTGVFKFIVQNAENDDGLGEKYLQLERLKVKLQAEGLFDTKYKKKIPLYPTRIGVVTSLQGAAIQDIYKTMKNNAVHIEMIIFPSLVQGSEAPYQLIDALQKADNQGLDLIIITRGGGSFEDLFCFNDEDLARTIFKLNTPIISAIGHESDVTICDLVADLRASTPTQSVNFLPNLNQELDKLINLQESILKQINHLFISCNNELSNYFEIMKLNATSNFHNQLRLLQNNSLQIEFYMKDQIKDSYSKLNNLYNQITNALQSSFNSAYSNVLSHKEELIDTIKKALYYLQNQIIYYQKDINLLQFFNELNYQANRLTQLYNEIKNELEKNISNNFYFIENQKNNLIYFMQNIIQSENNYLKNLNLELQSYNYQQILEKGFSITLKDGKLIKAVSEISAGDIVETLLKDGSFKSLVK